MKTIRYIISFLIITTMFISIGEGYQLYLDSFENEYISTTLYLKTKESNTEEKMISDILDASQKYNVEVFVATRYIENTFKSTLNIYGTENIKYYIENKSHIYEKNYRSIFLGSKNVNFYDLNYILDKENLNYINEFYLVGSSNNIRNFKLNLMDNYAGNFPNEGINNTYNTTVLFMAIISFSLMILLLFFDIAFQKKEIFLKIALGESIKAIISKNIILDFIIHSIMFVFSLCATSTFTNSLFKIKYIMFIYFIFILLNSLAYFTIRLYDVRKILTNSNFSKNLLNLNYIIKLGSILLTVIILVSNFSIIFDSYKFYKQGDYFKKYKDYYYISFNYKTAYDDKSNNIDTIDMTSDIREIFYRTYFNKFDAQGLVTTGLFGKSVLIANKNNISYLSDNISSLKNKKLDKDVYFLFPKNYKDKNISKEFIVKTYLEEYIFDPSLNISSEVITYTDNSEFVYTDELSKLGSGLIKNPVIIFNNIDMTKYKNNITENIFNLEPSANIMYKLNDKELNKFKDEHNLENRLNYTKTNVLDRYEHQLKIVKRTMYMSIILCLLIIFLETIVIKTIIMLEYTVNSIELSLKKVLGYTILESNKKIFFMTIIPIVICILISFILSILLNKSLYSFIIVGLLILLIIELSFIFIYIKKIQKNNIQKILKGGAL